MQAISPTVARGVLPVAGTAPANAALPTATPTPPADPPTPLSPGRQRIADALEGRSDEAADLDKVDAAKRRALRHSRNEMEQRIKHRAKGADDDETTRIKRNQRTTYYARHHRVVDKDGVVWSAHYDKKSGELKLVRANEDAAEGARRTRTRTHSDDGSSGRLTEVSTDDAAGGSRLVRDEASYQRDHPHEKGRHLTGHVHTTTEESRTKDGGRTRHTERDEFAGAGGIQHVRHNDDVTTTSAAGDRHQVSTGEQYDPDTHAVIFANERVADTGTDGREHVDSNSTISDVDGTVTQTQKFIKDTRPDANGVPSHQQVWAFNNFDHGNDVHDSIITDTSGATGTTHEAIYIDHDYADGAPQGTRTRRTYETDTPNPDGTTTHTGERNLIANDANGKLISSTTTDI